MNRDPCTLTVDQLLSRSAQRYPLRDAVIVGEKSFSYGALDAASTRLACRLRALGAPVRIALILPNSFEWVVCCFAIAKAGSAMVPLNPAYTDRELQYILSDASIEIAICRKSHAERLRAFGGALPLLRDCLVLDDLDGLDDLIAGASDRAFDIKRDWRTTHSILYTSGTTGRPKGAVLSHRSRIINSMACRIGCDFGPATRLNCPIPLFHSGGMTLFMLNVLAAGGTLVIPRDAGPDATLAAIQTHGVNALAAVPTILARLLDSDAFIDVAGKLALSVVHGGSPMPAATGARLMSALPHANLYHVYGSTEAPQLTVMGPDEYRTHPTATGRALQGTEVRVVDEAGAEVRAGQIGQIITAGPHLFDGYLNAAEKTGQVLRDGVFWTGDLATIDDIGLITIVGRGSDLIISGGLNVYAKEVEDVLHGHPHVQNAAVFGVPDAEWGEAIGAAIILRSGREVSAEELVSLCRSQLASYKKPRQIWFVDEFPFTPAGKVQKFELLRRLTSNEGLAG